MLQMNPLKSIMAFDPPQITLRLPMELVPYMYIAHV